MTNSYPVYGYGHDYGNADCNGEVVGSNGRYDRRIPSVTSIGSWQKVLSTAAGAGREVKDILAHNHYVLEYDNADGRRVEKYIGQKVFDDGAKPMDTHGDSERYWKNNYSLEMLMTTSGSLIADQEYGLHVVTGLPISIYLDNPNNAELVKQALSGTHVYSLNGRQRVLHVESVRCIMEGAGALIAYGSRENVLQGVIDIGGRTTDLFVARGQKPRPANAKGFSLGVSAAADRFSEKFRERYHYTVSAELRMELLRQHVSQQQYRTVKDRNGIVIPPEHLRDLIANSLREIGQEIATTVVASWDEILMEFESILIVGGGAYYFSEDIQARIRQSHCAPKPETANVAGYASLAEAARQRLMSPPVSPRGI